MSNIIDIFSIPAGVYDYPNDCTNELSLVKNLEYLNSSSNSVSNDKFLLNRKDFEILHSFCTAAVNDYWSNVLKNSGHLAIIISWANKTQSNQSHHKHYHSNSVISGSFYFDSVVETPITLCNPNEKLKWYDVETTEQNKYNSNEISLAIDKPGVILFPSYLDHYVKSNETTQERYSIAFNTFFQGTIGSLKNATFLGQEIDIVE